MPISSIPTGARCVFSLNGKVLAYARSVAVSEAIDYQPIETLNDLRIREFCPTSYRVTLSCEVVRLIGTTLKSMGFFAATAQDASTQLVNILNTGDLVATIEDSVTGTVLATVSGVKIASHSWSIDARGLAMESVEFVAVELREESDAA